MKKTILITPLLLQACVSNGVYQDDEFDPAPKADQANFEVMACYDLFDHDKEKIIVGLAVNYDVTYEDFEDAGVIINSADIMHSALHNISGLNRVWLFDCDDDDNCYHQIHLKPSGKAHYYDFSDADKGESVAPSMSLECEYDADYEQYVNKGYKPDPAPVDVEIKNTGGTKI